MNRTVVEQVSPATQHKQAQNKEDKQQQKILILKLEEKPRHRVSWTQDTIDNEGMNKKKSNLCCIYHRPGDESSDTCTSDDEGNALERDRHTKHLHKKKCSKLKKKQQRKQQEEGGNEGKEGEEGEAKKKG